MPKGGGGGAAGGGPSQEARIRAMHEAEKGRRKGARQNKARRNRAKQNQKNSRSNRSAKGRGGKTKGANAGGGGGGAGTTPSAGHNAAGGSGSKHEKDHKSPQDRTRDAQGRQTPADQARLASMMGDNAIDPLEVFDAYYFDPKETPDWDNIRAFRDALIHKYRYQQPQFPSILINHIKAKHLQRQVYVQTLQLTCNDQFSSYSGCLQRTNNDVLMCEGPLTALAKCKASLERGDSLQVAGQMQQMGSGSSVGSQPENQLSQHNNSHNQQRQTYVQPPGDVAPNRMQHRNQLLSQLNPFSYPSFNKAGGNWSERQEEEMKVVREREDMREREQEWLQRRANAAAAEQQRTPSFFDRVKTAAGFVISPPSQRELQLSTGGGVGQDGQQLLLQQQRQQQLQQQQQQLQQPFQQQQHPSQSHQLQQPQPQHASQFHQQQESFQQQQQQQQHQPFRTNSPRQSPQIHPSQFHAFSTLSRFLSTGLPNEPPISPYPQQEHVRWTRQNVDHETRTPPPEPTTTSARVLELWNKWSGVWK